MSAATDDYNSRPALDSLLHDLCYDRLIRLPLVCREVRKAIRPSLRLQRMRPARPPAPPIPEQEAAGKAVAAADDSMTGGISSASVAEPAPAKKSNEMRLKEMVQRINLEEVPENDVWLRLGQLTYAQERESSMNNLIELFITRAHPLVKKETRRYDPEYTAIMP